MPIGSTNVYNSGDLILSTVSGSGTSFIETKIIAATSSLILFNASGTLTSQSLNSTTVGTSSFVSGSTSIITNLTASNISASSKIQANQLTASSILASNGPLIVTGSNAYVQMFPVGGYSLPSNLTASYIYTSGSTNDMYFTQYNGPYTNTTRLRWIESNLYTGILHGGVLTSTPGSTTFTVTNGEGIIVTMNAFTASAPYPTVKLVSWPTSTQPIINSGSAKITYVGIDNVGAIVQQTNAWGSSDINQWDNQIALGVVLHLSGSVSNGVFNSPQISYANPQQADDFFRSFGPLKISGHTLQASGSSPTLSIKKSGGTAYREGANYLINPNHPSTVVENAITSSKIYRYYLSGSTPVIDTGVANAGYTTIDNDNYVNTATGQLTSVGNSNWTVQRVFWIPNSPTNAFLVYYGNASYPTLLDAVNAKDSEPFTEAPNTALNGIFVGYIIIEGGAGRDLLDSTECTIIQGGLFRNVGGVGSSGTAPVSTTLAGLSDVALSGLSAGDLLVYGGGQWNNNKTLTGNYIVSGSLSVTSGVTANLTGTSSWATNAVTSSFALTASYVNGSTSIITNLTASNISASGTIIANSFTGSFSGSITNAVTAISASFSTNSLTASYLTPTNSYTITNLTASNISASNALSSSNVWFGNSMVYVETMITGSLTAPDVNFTSTAITGSDVMMKIDATALTGSAVALQINASGSQTSYAISASNGTIIGTIFSGSAFSGNFTGSVFGTSSWATNSLTASYLTPANSYTIAGLTNNGSLSQQGTLSMGSGYQLLATTGTAPIPGISFVGDTNTGIYAPAADTLGFSISGSERVRIDSNGNVGIGTSSPAAGLDVSKATSYVGINGTDTFLYLRGYNTGRTAIITNAGSSGNYNGLAIITNETNANSLSSWRMDIGGYDGISYGTDNFWIGRTPSGGSLSRFFFINNSGNVGIGTTSPGEKLSVISGSTRIASTSLAGALFLGNDNSNIYLQRDNSYDLSLVQNGDSNSSLYLASAGSVYVNIDANNNDTDKAFIVQNNALKAGTELFRVSETGNVGIGSSSPGSKLEVIGGTNTRINLGNIDDVNRGGKLEIISGSVTARQFYVGTNSAIYNLVFGIDSIEKMRIDTAGNVGIGTTSPATTLNVSGSTRISAGELQIEGDNASIRLYRTTGINYFDWASGQNLYFGTVTSIGGAGRSNKMVLLDGGNVGIGTGTPVDKLHVLGSVTAGANTSTSGTTILQGYYNNGSLTVLGSEFSSGGPFLGYGVSPSTASVASFFSSTGINIVRSAYIQDGGTHRWYTGPTQTVAIGSLASLSERMRIDGNGNLGIGTTSGTTKLYVSGSITATDGAFISNVTTGTDRYFLNFYGTATNQIFTLYENNSTAYLNSYNTMAFRANQLGGSNGYFVFSGANVGIGTSSPGAKLEITGSSSDVLFNINSPISGNIIYVSGSGRVGINKSTPISALDVSGSVTITGSLNLTTNITCLSLTETSTEAVKYNISPLPSQLENVLKLKPVSFNYKTNNKHSIGLIAEEVAKIYPEFTSETNDSISYGKITSVLIQSIKELKNIIDNQQKQIEDLSNKLK